MQVPAFSLNPKAENALWRKFIDVRHWGEAMQLFPEEPQRFYLKPHGEFPESAWQHFQAAVEWVYEPREQVLDVNQVLTLTALVLRGDASAGAAIIRPHRAVWLKTTLEQMQRVYSPDAPLYLNSAGLELKVEGYWPFSEPPDEHTLNFLVAVRELVNPPQNKELQRRENLRTLLKTRFDEEHPRWMVIYLMGREAILEQLTRIMAWYEHEAASINLLERQHPEYKHKVVDLAVKMQRYVDICHLGEDGSGRSSRLLFEYVLLRFGIRPPINMRFSYNGDDGLTSFTLMPEDAALALARSLCA